MLLIALAAIGLAVQTATAANDVFAPAMTPDEVATVCFAAAGRLPGERDRECQYRVLAEEARRVERIVGLRRRCERRPSSPPVPTDECVLGIIAAEEAAATAAATAARARAEARAADPFDTGVSWDVPATPAAAPAPPPPPVRTGCRRETVRNPDGSGGSVSVVCGDPDLADEVRRRLQPAPQ